MGAFVSFAFTTFFWSLFNFFIYHSENPLFDVLSYATGPIIITSLLIWVYTFSLKERERLPFATQFIIYFLGLTFSGLALFTDFIIFDIEKSLGSGFIEKAGVLFPAYVSYIFLGYVVVLWKLTRLYKDVETERKPQVRTILTGFSIYGALSVLFSLILPLVGYDALIDFDVPSSMIFVAFTSYAIINYRLMDIKLISVELFSILLVIVTFINFIISPTLVLKVYGLFIFIIVMTLSIFMVRSVVVEVKRKEELQDMSDRLARANEELRKLDNAKSEFISIASHQLRTPLTAIKGFLSLIMEGSYGKVSPEIQDVLNKVYASNDRIVQLVENLLNISRIESGRIQYQFEKSSIEDILKDLSDMFFVMAKNKNLTLTFTIPKKKFPLLYMDAGKIREVISNLIDNAFKYTEKGGVNVALEQRGAVARITVSDTGMGIEAATIPHLFSKFIRGSKEASRVNVAGTGLGLYVGRSFIEAHHGKIWIESEGAGKGSRFIVELPIV